MCNHWWPLHRSHAPSRVLRSVLPLLWQLWREDVPEADVVHPLVQDNALLGLISHHSHHPVSVSRTRSPGCSSAGLTSSSSCSIGNVLMFYANQALKVNIKQGPLELNRTMENIRTFLTAVPEVRVWSPAVNPFTPRPTSHRSHRIHSSIQFCCYYGLWWHHLLDMHTHPVAFMSSSELPLSKYTNLSESLKYPVVVFCLPKDSRFGKLSPVFVSSNSTTWWTRATEPQIRSKRT